jgi:hypothetical protein
MIDDANPTNGPLLTGDPIVPGFFRSFSRSSGARGGRQMVIVAVVVVVLVVAVGVGLVVFSSMSRQTQSYKDGFSAGGAVYALDGTAELGARQACRATELRGSDDGGLPPGANPTEWLNGCIAAFNSAQGGT